MLDIQAVALEDISSEVCQKNLHHRDKRHDLEEVLVAGDVVEKVELLGSGVEGVEDGNENEKCKVACHVNLREITPFVHPVFAGKNEYQTHCHGVPCAHQNG